jgi:hypothetical protein
VQPPVPSFGATVQERRRRILQKQYPARAPPSRCQVERDCLRSVGIAANW